MTKPNDMVTFAMKPSGWVLFLRTFLPYQMYRFLWVNLRMAAMIWKSHSHAGNHAAIAQPAASGAPAVQALPTREEWAAIDKAAALRLPADTQRV